MARRARKPDPRETVELRAGADESIAGHLSPQPGFGIISSMSFPNHSAKPMMSIIWLQPVPRAITTNPTISSVSTKKAWLAAAIQSAKRPLGGAF
jgi:hypothetical protein